MPGISAAVATILSLLLILAIKNLKDLQSHLNKRLGGNPQPPRVVTPREGIHSCEHCAGIVVQWPAGPIDKRGFNVRLPISSGAVHRGALAGCKFLARLDRPHFSSASASGLVNRIFEKEGWLAKCVGLDTRFERFKYVVAGLSPYHHVLHFHRPVQGSRYPNGKRDDKSGPIFCDALLPTRSIFEFDVTTDYGLQTKALDTYNIN